MSELMHPIELLILTDNLSRTAEVLRPGETMPFRRYWRRRLGRFAQEIGGGLRRADDSAVWMDGHVVTDPDSQISVRCSSHIALCRQRGETIDVLTRPGIYRADLN